MTPSTKSLYPFNVNAITTPILDVSTRVKNHLKNIIDFYNQTYGNGATSYGVEHRVIFLDDSTTNVSNVQSALLLANAHFLRCWRS